MDGGGGLNLIYVDTLNKLQMDKCRIKQSITTITTHGDKTRTRENKYNLTPEMARVGVQIGKVTSGVLQHSTTMKRSRPEI